MAGHYRVIAPTAQVGQPEVKLGLIPGAGGTQRLPRLAGVEKAVEMCASGESVKAQDAVKLGVADRVIDGDLLQGAIAFAREVANQPIPRTRFRDDKLRLFHPATFDYARQQAKKLKRGYQAPLAAIEAVEAATKLNFENGCQREQEIFRERLYATESKALIHAFFAERSAGKIPDLPKDTRTLEIRRAAVVGAGTMGGGIAMTYANAGIPVIVKETLQDALDRGLATIRKNYENTVKKGRLSAQEMERRLALITPQLSYDGFEQADIVVEAVFESMRVKKQVFAELDVVAKEDCILATNTSTLDVDEIASATKRPQMVIGTHFFSPANVMKLLEVVRGTKSSSEVITTAMALGKRLGKVAVLARNAFGFIGNRMVVPYVREAQFLVEEGASVEQVNDALYEFGMPMGPLAMDDLAGLDVMHHVRLESKHLEKPGVRRPMIAELLYERGWYGQKTGRGWSRYDENRKPEPDSEVATLIEESARKAGIERRQISNEEIVNRCVLALVNEGAKVLEEGIALRAADIDIVYIYGYGFPAYRGGPMFYADSIGLENVLARVKQFEERHGADLWRPAKLLKDLAGKEQTFGDWDRLRAA